MNSQTKVCQNCKQKFVIEPEDFVFYEKIKVPAPTFCPGCRFQRRLMFVNVMRFYKRKCDLCGKNGLSIFHPESDFTVYCPVCWWSDKWDSADYAQKYDPTRNFFEQLRELQKKVPVPALFIETPSMQNSGFTNYAAYLKNCYLIFEASNDENCYYGWIVNYCKDTIDSLSAQYSELCYENINLMNNYETHFSEDCEECRNVYFSKMMTGCSDCFACANLRSKKYHIFNRPYSKEEYVSKLKEFKKQMASRRGLKELKGKAEDFWKTQIQRAHIGISNMNVSGEYISYSKNTHDSYMVVSAQDSRYLQFIVVESTKDSYDYTTWGEKAELIYDCVGVGEGAYNMKFDFGCWAGDTMNVEYSIILVGCKNMFGCVGMRKKEYCVLNKQYSKEDYEKLRARIVEDMNKNPHVDSKGRVFKYGEFFPHDLSYFSYNETQALYFFPLKKDEAKEKGFGWQEKDETISVDAESAINLPDNIADISDSALNKPYLCASCKRPFVITKNEVDMLRRWGFSLPDTCFYCRHEARFARLRPYRLYDRKCSKCESEIKTSFAPQDSSIVYCEKCYNTEVV